LAFVCICNPVDVWDHEAFFASNPKTGYWVFPEATFARVTVGDKLYLRLTSKAKYPGVCGQFTVTGKRTGVCPSDHWREGKHPEGLKFLVEFSVDTYFPHKRVTPEEMKMSEVLASSALVKVPQRMATDISDGQAKALQSLIDRHISAKAI
jgi:hypothetical protein